MPYLTTDIVNPINVYGASKAAGERLVVENNNDNLSDIAIYDVTGKLITTRNSLTKGKYEIEINAKTQMYIVKLSNNTTTNTYKVILY